MKKHLIAISAMCLCATGFSSTVLAKPNAPDPLATVTVGGCSLVQIAPFGTSQLASWSWSDGTSQTKFGGDAVYLVQASDGLNNFDGEIEFELEQYVPGTLASDYPGVMVYRCSNAITDATGSCNGSVLGLRDAIRNAAAEQLGVLPADVTTLVANLVGVYVKAMNPGHGSGRQNYELVNVCDVPL